MNLYKKHFSIVFQDHPCLKNKSGCSHFCIGNKMNYRCDCPDGMELDKKDLKTCIVVIKRKLLL